MSKLVGIAFLSSLALLVLRATGIQTHIVVVDQWVEMIMSLLSISVA